VTRLAAILLSVTAFCWGAPDEPARPFSHQLHSKMRLECARCHPAAPASVKRADNLLPDPKSCIPCHENMPVRQEPTPVWVKDFNHALHLKLGNVAPVIAAAIDKGTYLGNAEAVRPHLNTKNACAACHRGLETSTAVTKAAFPVMADCLVCHDRIDPPFSCEKCHTPGPELKPATHTADFLDRHTLGLAKLNLDRTTCAVCHGRRFTCLGCH
jgi:hypothetical protein